MFLESHALLGYACDCHNAMLLLVMEKNNFFKPISYIWTASQNKFSWFMFLSDWNEVTLRKILNSYGDHHSMATKKIIA